MSDVVVCRFPISYERLQLIWAGEREATIEEAFNIMDADGASLAILITDAL